ncbi:RnfABCDGE type electron transport complex subunit D [Thiorhodovibrio frisius]|uniref:Ion-translocating oxidoreductase complex subunit D n=1 Tax=Thiorhodovibrio frisius TaxID=631362 RepID=H8Z3N8_9GAMM|nr:RnfABCDGE type electron transport complex subunit D [Thiorhodovibrio frisius]EIC20027.1 electron transport complex, RnfABCDGE type, D subunit [Thiorhodovibrio frisius]WPL20755.1 Nitrogen fixation protein RnfD [Thiorhodovibrio frisius]
MLAPTYAASPHTHAQTSVARTMRLVMLALVPATLLGLYQFGWPAIFLFGITVLGALLWEALGLKLSGKSVRPGLMDGSALLTGWLLAMTLPPWAPWWVGLLGAFLAIIVGKQIFGGLGQNLFNPAMVARIALLIALPLEMTSFVSPAPLFSAGAPGFLDGLSIAFGGAAETTINTGIGQYDALSGASVLNDVRTSLGLGQSLDAILPAVFDPFAALWGGVAGSLGETSALLLLLGGLFLLQQRVIRWEIPLAVLASIGLMAGLMHLLDAGRYPGPLFHWLQGATLLCAFFIATDPVTSPVSRAGQLVFGAGCGVLIYVIRTWGGYPEGVGFAVLLMNACTPLIDHYLKPRIYGRDRRGQPLKVSETKATPANPQGGQP